MKSTSIACLVLTAAWAAVWSTVASPQTLPPAAGTATLFEGARLIAGDGSAPIDNSAFVVQNNRFVRIGKKGEITLPQGAAAVDLSGKTVMPALIEVHAHLGYFKTNTERRPSAAHFTREQLLNDLQQFAYYGVGSVLSLGADRREVVYQVRDEWRAAPPPNTARFFTAGQGLAAPNAGPAGELENAVYPVTSEADARKDVQELAAHKVDGWVKIWHDSRRGKMPLPVIQAIIDEAHKQKLRVAAHIQELQDFKDLLRMGIDVLAHPTWRQESVPPVDDELLALLKEHPNVFMCTTFWTPRNQIYGARPEWIDEPILNETFSPQEIKALENPSTPRDAAEKWATGRVPQAMKTLKLAGVGFVLGTDMGGGGAGYYGFSSHVEMESMVKAGLTASEAIVAATRNSARMLGIDDLGTIAAGKTADFIVLDANPLDNIANTRRISNVYLGGQLVDRDGLRAKWAVRSAAVPYRPVDNWAHLPAGMAWVVSGDAPDLFNGPTDVIVMPAGDVFVTDGQFNSRVLHYTANGTFVNSSTPTTGSTSRSSDRRAALPSAAREPAKSSSSFQFRRRI